MDTVYAVYWKGTFQGYVVTNRLQVDAWLAAVAALEKREGHSINRFDVRATRSPMPAYQVAREVRLG